MKQSYTLQRRSPYSGLHAVFSGPGATPGGLESGLCGPGNIRIRYSGVSLSVRYRCGPDLRPDPVFVFRFPSPPDPTSDIASRRLECWSGPARPHARHRGNHEPNANGGTRDRAWRAPALRRQEPEAPEPANRTHEHRIRTHVAWHGARSHPSGRHRTTTRSADRDTTATADTTLYRRCCLAPW